MFVVASTGRCATQALCHGLDRFSDHTVEHEPEPRLLREAYLKHRGLEYETPALAERMRFFAERDRTRYGQSVRAAPLLPEIHAAAPRARILILVRPPLEYVVSAHAKKVLRRGDEWDRMRIMPRDATDGAPLAHRLAQHWIEVNRHLLDFGATAGEMVRVAVLERLEQQLDEWADFLGVRIHDRGRLVRFVAGNPNAARRRVLPDGFDAARLEALTGQAWARARSLAGYD
jgi:hypothetical protein